MKKEIFNRVRIKLVVGGRGRKIRYEPVKIAQYLLTTSVLAVKLPMDSKEPRIDKYD